MKTLRRTLQRHWIWLVANVGAAVPLLWLVWDYSTANLSADPVRALELRTGKAALVLLVLSLAVTPVNTVFGFKPVLKIRRSLGLWAFGYVCVHLLVFLGLDYGFSLHYILMDGLVTKPYIVVGFSAFLILLPLALTSTKGWMKRLGRNWKRLHKWVYLAGILAVLHYIWIGKLVLADPVFYAVSLTLLLTLRVPAVRKQISRVRQRFLGPKGPARPAGQSRKQPAVAAEA